MHNENDDDHVLWHLAMQDVAPLKGRKAPTAKPPAPRIKTITRVNQMAAPAPAVSAKEQARDMDKRTLQKLESGKMPIDGVLDLHGFTQNEAHTQLIDTLVSAHKSGKRCVLVITGKGRGGTGILRNRLPDWLNIAPLQAIVLRHVRARPNHGGGGAFYVFLRRIRA